MCVQLYSLIVTFKQEFIECRYINKIDVFLLQLEKYFLKLKNPKLRVREGFQCKLALYFVIFCEFVDLPFATFGRKPVSINGINGKSTCTACKQACVLP